MRLDYNTLIYLNSIYVSETYYTGIQPISGNYIRSFQMDTENNFLKLSKVDKFEIIIKRPYYIKCLYKQLKGQYV